MNNFNAKEIRKARVYLQDKLDMFKSKEKIKNIIIKNRESVLTKILNFIFKKKTK